MAIPVFICVCVVFQNGRGYMLSSRFNTNKITKPPSIRKCAIFATKTIRVKTEVVKVKILTRPKKSTVSQILSAVLSSSGWWQRCGSSLGFQRPVIVLALPFVLGCRRLMGIFSFIITISKFSWGLFIPRIWILGYREEGTLGCLLHKSSMFYNKVFLFVVSTTLGTFI